MGVTGLWKLIEPCGKPVPVETLEGKILAIDISIWLHQVVKGFQDNKGAALNNAHLLGLFHRLCKLMYYRIKPVFVFDGCVPQLKKDTIARRQRQRSKLNSEADRIQTLLLQSLAKEKVVQEALGSSAELLIASPTKKLGSHRASRKDDSFDDLFKLPELPCTSQNNANYIDGESGDDSYNENSVCSENHATSSATDSSFDESNARHAYNSNLQSIDVKSKEFLHLPADVRHEILVDIKETRKQSSWGRLHELPSRSDDFSCFQMKRLLKRRDVQVSLEAAEQEMGGHTLTYAELTNIFSEEGILETDVVERGTKQITSDEHTRFLLVKDLKKKLANVKEESTTEEKVTLQEEELSSGTKSINEGKDKKLNDEYNADLELAIALSLEDDTNKVYDEKDYEYDSDESLKLSRAQRQQLQNAAKGPARSYMIEYAGMNKDEVAGILEKTQVDADLDNLDLDIERLIGYSNEKDHEMGKLNECTSKEPHLNNESEDIRLCVTDDSQATDSDLEEVGDAQKNTMKDIGFNKDLINSRELKAKENEKEESDTTDTDFEEVEDIENINIDVNSKTLPLEDECVIEETPPYLQYEKEVKSNDTKTLNIKIDLTKSFETENDLFVDVFDEIITEKSVLEENECLMDSAFKKENTTEETSAAVLTDTKNTKHLLLNKDEIKINTAANTEKFLSILNELKQQADEIKNIKLENIKLGDAIIEISDDEMIRDSAIKNEVIEVCDSDDNEKRSSTPPLQVMGSSKSHSKSPSLRTPSKNHSITEFFNMDYVVKRTPDKPIEEENTEVIPKVKSPFFHCKTPKSEQKISSNSPSPDKRSSKANKILFDHKHETSAKNDAVDNLEDDFTPLKKTKTADEQDILNEAVNTLKSQKTTEELTAMASNLAKERQELENERNRQDRMGISITQRMNTDCQDLLRLFGVPFIVAPMEAEAQCAFLDIVQLTDGTITDDSDIWLFGGRTVYKNFFAQNKHVMRFHSEQIEKDFNCDRKKLIQLACLVGSDYTTGIHGIGTVTALEILASFTPKEKANNPTYATSSSAQTILATLEKFRCWWETFKVTTAPPGNSARLALQKKLKNIDLYEGFPSTAVVEAYLTPKVDENKDAFTWGYPDVESIREFARKTFGWTTSKTDDILMPVLKKLNEKRTQQSIRNYFNVKNALSLRQIRVSKRVQNAIEKMSGNIDSDDTAENPTKAKRARKPKTAASRKKINASVKVIEPELKHVNEVTSIMEPSCSSQSARGPLKRVMKRVNIPENKEIIPQREKDLEQMEANKRKAAEILKNTTKKIARK